MGDQQLQDQLPDEELERRIESAERAYNRARTPLERKRAFSRMRGLISRRSPAQVERMEREKGLRSG